MKPKIVAESMGLYFLFLVQSMGLYFPQCDVGREMTFKKKKKTTPIQWLKKPDSN
jgi:hypothetical protein